MFETKIHIPLIYGLSLLNNKFLKEIFASKVFVLLNY